MVQGIAMANTRSVVFEGKAECSACEEKGESCGVCAAKERIVQELASRWNAMHEEDERDSFRSREDREAQAEFEGERDAEAISLLQEKHMKDNGLPCETTTQINAFAESEDGGAIAKKYFEDREAKKAADVQKRQDERTALEELLRHYGARMARPYEHWNEMEDFMRYHEEDRWSGDHDY
jgi:hypothetical protein